ncbi:MAG: HAD family phosphatase, partial [Patescibacteria group bacterium]|nr:HAD family phosphatase [Patescibacteria group bacterium]
METLYIFDIDGVLTNPDTKVPNTKILHFMAEELNKGWHVAIATGRSSVWVQQHILPLLSKDLQGDHLLDNLFVSCEKGAVTITFSKSIPNVEIDTLYHIPHEIQEIIKEAINGMEGVFFDPDKKTMVSVEIEGGSDTQKVSAEKNILHELEEWVQDHIIPEFPDVHMDKSEISMDIQNKHIDKRIASEKLLDFLKRRNIKPTSFVAFGDSPTDATIAEKIVQEEGKAT